MLDTTVMAISKQGSSIFTILSLAEGEILNFMEGKKGVTLADILNQLGLPEPIVMMSIGGLIREGLINAKSYNEFLLLTERIC